MKEETDMMTFLTRNLRALATEAGLTTDNAKALTTRLVGLIRENFGGERHYIRTPSKTFRNEDIARDWDRGMSKGEIAEKYGVHVATVSRVIALYRIPTQRPSQGDGLGPKGWGI